ncbi:hypothetical protein GCM10020229_42860 [Kitasatospora albolonga]|uniref:hypothetical protein n=1 Tax=Kitasatospora albolonga TaxID=68173 RepID=UPI0031EB7A7B
MVSQEHHDPESGPLMGDEVSFAEYLLRTGPVLDDAFADEMDRIVAERGLPRPVDLGESPE